MTANIKLYHDWCPLFLVIAMTIILSIITGVFEYIGDAGVIILLGLMCLSAGKSIYFGKLVLDS